MKTPTSLPTELDIYHAAELRTQWLALLDESVRFSERGANNEASTLANVCLDGAGVDQIDGAGVQLLLALAHGFDKHQRRLQITDPSPPLRAACEALGLAHLLAAAAPTPGDPS